MKINQIEWGDDSAENDRHLLEYFVPSQAIERLMSKSKTLVVGRKGSGKSPLLAKVRQDFSNKPNTFAISISPTYNSIRAVLNDQSITADFGSEVFFQHTWLRQIYLDLLCYIGNEQKGKFAADSLAFAREIAIQQGRTSKDFVENITDIVNKLKLKAGKLGDFGLQIEKELRDSIEIESFEHHVEALTATYKIVVLIDDLDLGWDNSLTANRMLLGLLAATNSLRTQHKNIHTITFLREDIYTVILQMTQHADKFRNVERIRWDKDSLIKLLEERINFNRERLGLTRVSDAFDSVFPQTIGTNNSDNWLIERTLSRPRELIQLVRSYTETVDSEAPSADLLKKVEPNYSSWKLADVCSEYTNQYPGLNVVTSCWSTRFRRQKYSLKSQEVDELFLSILSAAELNQPWFNRLVNNTDVKGLLNILYEVGIIGDFILGGPGGSKTFYSHEERHDPTLEEIQVHPCFRRALYTVERIRE